MSGQDAILSFKFSVKGIQTEAEIQLLTPETVLLRIDPKTPWDAEALRHLGSVLAGIAQTMPLKRC